MNRNKTISVLTTVIVILALIATIIPITDKTVRDEPRTTVSVRGETVTLLGYGPYRHMGADIAIQGFAQDYVTLIICIPLLLLGFFRTRSGKASCRLFFAGIAAYFFVQYTLYLAMATYNELFLVWVALAGCSLHLLVRLVWPIALAAEINSENARPEISARTRTYVGSFLLINGTLIALLWLSVIIVPLLDGTRYPADLDHFTTLIVQGFDLAFFLPPSLMAGWYFLRGRSAQWWMAPLYSVFLTIQMIALTAKIIGMQIIGVSAGPALVLIPLLALGAFIAAILSLRSCAHLPVHA